ncbi:hypothetical protein [Streptococcus sanguinis]|uniref:hypothetical protein n=1 Tax=Streptococcus sanguinis TaxID=1305 RepID=UPI001CC0DCA8|nr:hypothetical protein [Streptococcus sanguinis]MBZ2022144.1 hypothetical protein [Streptococcus sanguinis]MBZ2073762.1 hypothetical protein [Streptococcus sanguinis]MBZ2081685.1 hypothetical protein [Streptococcus sanguinis]MCC3165765.1 hypothetical protein [Streptococcus sanguinis]
MNREQLYKFIAEVGREKEFRLPFAKSVRNFDVAWLEQVPEELVDAYDQAVEEYRAALTQVMEQALNHLIDEAGENI